MLDILFPSFWSILAISSIGIFFGLVLSYAKLKLNVEKDPRIEAVLDALPGANCGACGMPGCSAYASKIVEGQKPINLCPVGGEDSVKKISAVMGMEAEVKEKQKARIHCKGGLKEAKNLFIYDGPKNCLSANQIMAGYKACSYGCLGFGDCMRACPFDAITINDNRLPVVDWDKCTGCGNCVSECPRGIISLVNENLYIHVVCRNREKGGVMKKSCSAGCIACKKCEKVCREEVFADNPDIDTAISVIDFLAVIDYEKCINCGKCAEVCPQNVISFHGRTEIQ
ncbi:MAG: RnfABCDGE type electron transport complex subunit B [Spirochaetes bacterium]|nr:RnfABCDGE type electron transport complex subunit B [Spirochaetota bacterium]